MNLSPRMKRFKDAGLLGCFDGTGVTSTNYKSILMDKYKPEWGFQNLMVIAAFRYCLGRRSYISQCCVDWLIHWWSDIDHHTKILILDEIQEAIAKNRAGSFNDVQEWKRVLQQGKDMHG